MKKHSPIFFALLVVSILISQVAFGATVGKIAGKATDIKTGEALYGTNVIIDGTPMGAATRQTGEYFIINVPPGTYTIRAQMMGYRTVIVENVAVRADYTTTVDFALEQTTAKTFEPVTITAERPIIQPDVTATTRFLSAQDLDHMPTRGYQEAAYQQTGVVAFPVQPDVDFRRDRESSNQPLLNIRGGRYNEVAYYVDGFSQQDPLTGLSSTAINQSAIQDVTVITGGFNAEYGRIMSGAVNVITQEGSSKYGGSFESATDNLAGDWIGANKYDYNIYDMSIGGPGLLIPVFGDKTNFYLSGERRYSGDRKPSSIHPFGNAILPGNTIAGWSWQGKFTYNPSPTLKFKLGGLGSLDDWREFMNIYYYDMEHGPRYKDLNYSVTGSMTQTLSPSAFYTLAGNYFVTDRKRGDGVYFDDVPAYSRPNGNPSYDQFLNLFEDRDDPTTAVERDRQGVVLAGDESHIYDDYLHRNSAYWGLKWDYTNQMNTEHQLKFGADFQRHTLRKYRHVLPVQVVLVDSTMVADYKELNGNKYPAKIYHSDPQSFLQDADYYGYYWAPTDSTVLVPGHWQYDSTYVDDQVSKIDTTWIGPYYKYDFGEKKMNSGRQAVKHPVTASAYFEDKFEFQGVVINAGLRYDYLNVDTKALKNPERPLGADNTTLDPEDLVNNKVQNVISPRIGVGFPISERTLFHVNYGKFFQQPDLEDLYVSYDYLAYMIRTNPYFNMFGNPNLKPEKTTAYEVGIDHQIASQAKLDIVAYYKDVRDLVEVTNIPSIPNAFSTYRNRDYGTIKGVDLGFSLARTQNITCNLAYSLSWAMGTGSVSNTQYNIAWTGSEIPKMTAPLAFDQRHKLSFDFDYRFDNHEGPIIAGKKPFENAGINLLFNVGSGQPYTPTFIYNEVTLAAVSVTPSGPINSKYGPWTYRVDLKADKGFQFGHANVSFYVWVLNVFNRRNAEYSYTSTGSPETTGWLQTPEGQKWTADNGQQGYELFRQAELNPNNFSVPRMVRFGIKTDF